MDRTVQIIFAIGIVTIAILFALYLMFPDFSSFKFGPAEVLRPTNNVLISESELYEQFSSLSENYSNLDKRIINLEEYPQISNANQTEMFELSDKVRDAVSRMDFDEAHFYANQMLEKEEGFFAYWTIAYVFSQQELFDEALPAYNKAVEFAPEVTGILNDRAHVLSQLGDIELALKDWERVLELEPDNKDALLNKIKTLDYFGRTEEQLEPVDTLVELEPLNPVFLNLKGAVLSDLGMPEIALQYYKQANEIQENWGFVFNIGKAYLAMKEYDKAIEYFDKSFSIDPSDSALIEKSRALSFLDKDKEALQNLDIVLNQFPDHSVALINKAKSLHKLGELEDTIEVYNQLIEMFPAETSLLEKKIDVLEELVYQR